MRPDRRGAALAALLLAACLVQAPEPVRYVVVRGDTLGEIATAHGVSVQELRVWNGIEGDLIEVGQVLEIHTEGRAEPAPPVPARSARRPRAASPAPAAADALVMPAPKPCLEPPSALSDDGEGMQAVASQGLTPEQVKTAFDAFVPRLSACLPEDFQDSASVQLDLVIGCDGRVADAQVFSGGGLSPQTLSCLTDRVRYAPFPAHDLPKGERARLPVRFAWTPPP